MAVHESTVILDFYSSRVCSGMEYWNVETRGALVGEGVLDSSVRIKTWMVPKTPLWSRKALERVKVSPSWFAYIA